MKGKLHRSDFIEVVNKYLKTGSFPHKETKVSSKPDHVDRVIERAKKILGKN